MTLRINTCTFLFAFAALALRFNLQTDASTHTHTHPLTVSNSPPPPDPSPPPPPSFGNTSHTLPHGTPTSPRPQVTAHLKRPSVFPTLSLSLRLLDWSRGPPFPPPPRSPPPPPHLDSSVLKVQVVLTCQRLSHPSVLVDVPDLPPT